MILDTWSPWLLLPPSTKMERWHTDVQQSWLYAICYHDILVTKLAPYFRIVPRSRSFSSTEEELSQRDTQRNGCSRTETPPRRGTSSHNFTNRNRLKPNTPISLPSTTTVTMTTTVKEDNFKAKQSKRIPKSLTVNLQGDNDVWVERWKRSKNGRRRSYFQSIKTDGCSWDEPSTGASHMILADEVLNYPLLAKYEVKPRPA